MEKSKNSQRRVFFRCINIKNRSITLLTLRLLCGRCSVSLMIELKRALKSSIYSSLLGSMVLSICFLAGFLIGHDTSMHLISIVGGALFYYPFIAIVSFFSALFYGSPIYYILVKLNFANYISASFLGMAVISSFFYISSEINYWFLPGGAFSGAIYHYAYQKQRL